MVYDVVLQAHFVHIENCWLSSTLLIPSQNTYQGKILPDEWKMIVNKL